ncbi:MAG: flagellar protein FlaG [Lachnospiraceae bacterium]|nr:flagellar protein FlaG [Lachnospiraceae bacterium]
MAIEPLSSVMTFQAQSAAKTQTQPVTPANTEVPADGETVNVDAVTASVTKTQTEDSESGNEGNGDLQQAQKQQIMNSQSTNEQLKKAIAEMNRKINNSNEEAVFGVHEETNRITIKIVDKDTKEIIKEFPPEKTLDMIAKVWEMAGLLVDEKR